MGKSKKKKLLVCVKGKSCSKADGRNLYDCLKTVVDECSLDDVLKVKKVGCMGMCKHSPVIKVEPDGVFYGKLKTVDALTIALHHMTKRKPLKSLSIDKKKRK